MSDLIDRWAVVDAIKDADVCVCYSENESVEIENVIDLAIRATKGSVIASIEQMPSAQPESIRTFVELVVRYPDPELCTYKEYKGKPYYSIKYIEKGETYVGYGTYNPEVLSQYLKEYFISSAQPEITPDGTLNVSIDADIANVGRILLSQTGTQRGGLYYKYEQPEPKWIPCEERLPDKDGLYLVTYFSGHARWTGTDEFLVDGTEESHWKYANIIAWQPLPKPFREGGDYA